MGKQHLDPFAIAARLLERLSASQRAGNIASALVDRALLVGVGGYQTRINGKAFTANQTGRHAVFNYPLKD